MSKEKIKEAIVSEFDESLIDLSKKLESYRIDVLEEIPPPEIAWEIRDSNSEKFNLIGTLGNFSLIKGKAKSRKSFLVNMAIATAVDKEILQNRLRAPLKTEFNQVMYFDTEQSKYHVQKAVKRVCTQINTAIPKNLESYGLRRLNPAERLQLVEYAIENTQNLGFVVIDGIRDLITSINDEGEATEIASKLLKWSEEYNIHIVVVLHENPGTEKARGHLGTELTHKAETVISIEVDKSNDDVSIVKPGFVRNQAFEPFAFEIDDEGLPIILEDYFIESSSAKKYFDVLELSSADKFEILKDVFQLKDSFLHSELLAEIKVALNKKYKGSRGKGDGKIKQLITESLEAGLLSQLGNRKPYQLGVI